MTDIIVALIAMLSTICAALIPKWLESRVSSNKDQKLKSTPLPKVFLIALFAMFGIWGTLEQVNQPFKSSLIEVYFFLGMAGITSVFFSRSAASHNQTFGVYVGNLSSIIACLFLLWAALTQRRPDVDYLNIYALFATVAIGWSLWLFWKNMILLAIVNSQEINKDKNNT